MYETQGIPPISVNMMIEFIERYAYFYSQEVQERLEKSNEDVLAGRYLEVNAADAERALEWLHFPAGREGLHAQTRRET